MVQTILDDLPPWLAWPLAIVILGVLIWLVFFVIIPALQKSLS